MAQAAEMTSRSIHLEVEGLVPAARADVFVAAAVDTSKLSRYFTGYPPLIPAVRAASMDGDGEFRKGALRTVALSDGTSIKERVLDVEVPALHRYETVEMNRLQRLICTRMISEWRFEEHPRGTRIRWSYDFHPRNFWVAPITRLVAKSFRKAMQRCVNAIASDFDTRADKTTS